MPTPTYVETLGSPRVGNGKIMNLPPTRIALQGHRREQIFPGSGNLTANSRLDQSFNLFQLVDISGFENLNSFSFLIFDMNIYCMITLHRSCVSIHSNTKTFSGWQAPVHGGLNANKKLAFWVLSARRTCPWSDYGKIKPAIMTSIFREGKHATLQRNPSIFI